MGWEISRRYDLKISKEGMWCERREQIEDESVVQNRVYRAESPPEKTVDLFRSLGWFT